MVWRPSSEWWRGDPSERAIAVLLKVPDLKAGAGGRSSSEPVRVAAAGYVVHGVPHGRFREHTSSRPAAVVALKQRSSQKGGEGYFPPCAAATVLRPGD
ncbi:Os06g0312833 [Oryza sativa Japonica Group]|uniref:Os06g0312833 protein n=1 Tax=Oryza sativa subsp. japonica TaxID=39947 RepID=A0A0P0WVR9_ORYSJ|nr:Os06g0312833 [Oryza sativa Japonica Group]